ncbi:MAG: hypothetical protein F6K42_02505 [Leptolyngbya sp. SIO1D8]|nr:hypothetical protein [Leptolyngbya sp. SIO1D8]
MSDPSSQLYQLLAESNARSRECLKIGKAAAGSISSRQQSIQPELEELRHRILEQGLGSDPVSEDRYLELLQSFRSLHQSA